MIASWRRERRVLALLGRHPWFPFLLRSFTIRLCRGCARAMSGASSVFAVTGSGDFGVTLWIRAEGRDLLHR